MIIPLEILPVAVANVAIPEATAGAVVSATPNGAPIKMLVVVPTYPLPPFTTVIAEIVPEVILLLSVQQRLDLHHLLFLHLCCL